MSVQFSSATQSCLTLCNPMDWSTPGFPVHHQLPELLKFMSSELVMPSNRLILCRPLLLLPSIFSSIRVFSNESVLCIRWVNYLEFQLQHQSFQWIFRTDFLLDGLFGSPWSPSYPWESSPTTQFKNINSSALSFLYSLTLISIHDCGKTMVFPVDWKNHQLKMPKNSIQNNLSQHNIINQLYFIFLKEVKKFSNRVSQHLAYQSYLQGLLNLWTYPQRFWFRNEHF